MVPPAPCPTCATLAAIPQPARDACKALLVAKNVNGAPVTARWKKMISDACEWQGRAKAYVPVVQSTGALVVTVTGERMSP